MNVSEIFEKNFEHFIYANSYFFCFLDLKPKIMGSETTYNTIFIGKTLFIFCAYEACDTPATVTWYKVI